MNVAKYMAAARAFEASHLGSETTLIHNNAYTADTLDECFERNSNGMLHNMLIHELALLATFYQVTTATIASVEADPACSLRETRRGLTSHGR